MPEFTAIGKVIKTRGNDLGVLVENDAEADEFWEVYDIDTDLNWFDKDALVISIGRKKDIAKCKVGDRVSITVKVVDRANGKRGIETVGFDVLNRKP